MAYTPSQSDAIRAYILKIGYTVNDKGCEVWNSDAQNRQPSFYLTLNGRRLYVNVRTFLWMDSDQGSSIETSHTSCGNTKCIKVDHIVPGRKQKASAGLPYVFTESDVALFRQKINKLVTQNEHGCHIWGGGLIRGEIPFVSDQTRNITVTRFLWTRENDDYNAHSHRLSTTCGDDMCVNTQHLLLEHKKKKFDRDHLWNLLLQKTTKIGDCLVLKKPGIHGYGLTNLAGETMASHRASYILNKNDGKPIPKVDEAGNRLVVRHLCPRKQPDCISPAHLELGTQMENMYEDRVRAGTIAGGIVHANEDQRRINRNKRRRATTASWSEEDFNAASKKIKANVVETEEGKSGQFPPGPCWIWQRYTTALEYGVTSFKNKIVKSHVLALESQHKRFLKPGEVVRHLCDQNPCSNPDHLRFGTRKENQQDIQLYGSSNRSKVNPGIVRHIRANPNASSASLAAKHGVSSSCVNRIRSGASWSYVT